MPARLSEAGQVAKQYGISYACAKYRLSHGIPLDRPVKHGDMQKAWDTRGRGRKKRHERKKVPAWQRQLRRARNPFACMVVR